MNAHKIIDQLKELGHVNSKREELREFCSEKFDQIIQQLSRRIVNSDGADVLNCLLNGIPHSPMQSLKNKIKVIQTVLLTLRKESTSLTHCGEIVSRLLLELPRMPPNALVRWSNESIHTILEDSDVNMIWRDILPECISALSSHDVIKHCDTKMTCAEYKEQCVHTLCQCTWSEKLLVPLAAMFKDMQLSRASHKQVVNKICSYIIDITPDTLPPLVHQLVKLCKLYNLEIVLSHLSHYFSVRLYSRLEPPPQDSESTTIDIDDIVPHSPEDLSRALFTCIYHLSQGVVEPEVLKKYIKMWPKTQILRAPFIIDLALAISDKGTDFRTICLDAIRSAIEQRVMDELRAKESAWVRSAIPPDVDVASVLKVITTESKKHGQLTSKGLINLAFALLAVSRTPAANACWSHGELILVRLSKARPELARTVLAQLADRLARDCTHSQYADCLYILCKLTPVSLERCPELTTILENCQPAATEYKTAAAVLDAVHPLLNFSTRTRDVLVMVCRKGLYSRDPLRRCLSVCGFLSVLRHVSVSRGAWSGSQRECSAHSYLTQLTVDLHATSDGAEVTSRVRNEAMCMEVVSILRRCLTQDAVVKQLLYTNVFDCVKEKAALHESILELLYEHLGKFLPDTNDSLRLDNCVQVTANTATLTREGSNESILKLLYENFGKFLPDTNDSLRLDNCVQVTANTATLTEPISHLLYVVAQFLALEDEEVEDILASQAVETGSAYLRSKLNDVMEKLCASDQLGLVDLDDVGLTDLTVESKAKCIKVQQILSCYESLIAYKIMQWDKHNTNANIVYKLFKACSDLTERAKAPSKLGKKNKTLNETKETVKSQKSQKSQKDKAKAPTKVSNLVKDRAGPFKPLPCVWDLKFCVRIMDLLYSEDVSWSSSEQRNQLVSRRDFHRWALARVQCGLKAADKRTVHHLVAIARILYHRVLCRLQAIIEFDDQTALACLEIFKSCLTQLLSPHCSLKMKAFLPEITGANESTPQECIAMILDQTHTALTQMDAEDLDQTDQVDRKTSSVLIAIAALLLEVPVHTCEEMAGIIAKYEEYIRVQKRECIALIPAVLSAAAREQQDAPFLDEVIAKLTTALGRIEDEDSETIEDTSNFPSIDARSGHTVLNHICAHLNARCKSVEHLLHRAQDLTTAANMAAGNNVQRIDKEVLEVYRCVVLQLCQLCSCVGACCSLRVSVGGGSERALVAAVRLYAALGAAARQLSPRAAAHTRFERLLKLSGRKMSLVMSTLITYLEASQSEQLASKVLRDTRLIPRLVLEEANYSNHVLLLAKKAKVDWEQYLSLGTARDFKIDKGPVLQAMLNAQDKGDTEDEDNINDATTEVVSPAPAENIEGTKRKRRKVTSTPRE